MKTIIFWIIIFVGANFQSISQNLSVKLVGEWQYIGTKYIKEIECPDLLIFNFDSTYVIHNDCYALDPIKPIVETGKWKIDKNLYVIRLYSRKISKAYVFQNTKVQQLNLYIKEFSDSLVEICFVNKTKCISEFYKKRNGKITECKTIKKC